MKTLIGGFPGARLSLAIHHVVTLAIAIDHLVDHGKRILQIRIQEHHGIAGSVIQSGGRGDLVPEIPGEVQHSDARVGGSPFRQKRERLIRTPVIHQNQFDVARSRGAGETVDRLAEQDDHGFLVVDRNHQGKPGGTLARGKKVARGGISGFMAADLQRALRLAVIPRMVPLAYPSAARFDNDLSKEKCKSAPPLQWSRS